MEEGWGGGNQEGDTTQILGHEEVFKAMKNIVDAK